MSPAELVGAAVAMLDEESHRYVERFVDCPNGCRYEVQGANSALVQVAGPAGCQACDTGQAEDENAEHLDPFIAELRQLAERLARAEKELTELCVEDWPEHMTCSEAESLAAVLDVIHPDTAGELIAAHAGGDDDPEDMHHPG